MSKNPLFHNLIQKFGPQKIIDSLSEHVLDQRKEKIDPVLENRIKSIHIAVESPADIHNALAIVRTCEAMGVCNQHLIGWKNRKQKGKKTMQGADRWTNLAHYDDLKEFRHSINQQGLILAGASPRGTVCLDQLPIDRPICLIFGNELFGLSEDAEKSCDLLYQIPMFGFTESYNLSVSAAISLYDILKRKRSLLNATGDLTEEEKLIEKAWFYLKTLGTENSHKILLKKNSESSL